MLAAIRVVFRKNCIAICDLKTQDLHIRSRDKFS